MTRKISLYEHIQRTNTHVNNIMDLSIEVLPKLADTLAKIKLRKAMTKLSHPEPTIKITEPIIDELNISEGQESLDDVDWMECTEQGLGTTNS